MEWNKTSEKMPKVGSYIIIYGPQTDLYFILSSIKYNGSISPAVTHWSYLPDQPERSKREDSSKDEMRCSEHCGNTVREVQ